MLDEDPSRLPASGALSVDEFERLQELLDRVPGSMNVETLDGYFAALICAPVQASIGLRFGAVCGADVLADAALGDAADWVERDLWRHWCTIDGTLRTALEDLLVEYQPLLFEDDAGAVAANDWASGFLQGVADDPRAWADFERATPGALDAVRRLAAEPASGARLDDDARQALLAVLPTMLVTAYRFFEPLRH